MTLTPEQLQKIVENWSPIIQAHIETIHSTRLEFVPKGDPDNLATLLANWGQAIPNTYPEPTEAQVLTALAVVEAEIITQDSIAAVEAGADAQILAIPDFARWTEPQFLDWIANNISDTQIDAIANLTEAKVFMKKQTVAFTALMRMVVGLRNKVAPHIQNSS